MFETIESAEEMVRSQSGIASPERENYILNILEISKGVLENEVVYRPYLVAALTMWSSKPEQTITEASGSAKFRYEQDRMNLRPAIESNLRMQRSIDLSLGLEVPAGWAVEEWLNSLCGCANNSFDSNESLVFGAMAI